MNKSIPQVGSWYLESQQGITFEVVAVDEMAGTVETQLVDGAVTEFDLDNWYEMTLIEVDEPEDWRNGYELSSEDYLDPDDTIYPEDWSGPLNSIETDIVNGTFDDL